ncbi:MAG: hypothetical protein CMO01_20845 [Thalassobius sp.]|nr:hypothetical protein [Thalassovita sp.]
MKLTKLLGILFLFFCLSSCDKEIEQFNKDKPYAIIIDQYRSLETAWNSFERVKEMGIDGYLAEVKDPATGTWYMLLTGSYKTLESAIAGRIKFEDSFSFLYLDIVNYNQLSPNLVAYVDKYKPMTLPDSLTSNAYNVVSIDLMKKAPYSGAYSIIDVQTIQPSDSIEILKRTSLRTNQFDMPRGIYPPDLINSSDAIIEAVYLDELIGVEFKVDLFALKPSHEFGADVSQVFADKIKDTREYNFEEILPRSVSGGIDLKGFAVNIEPTQGKVYRYMVLSDLKGRYLYFIQSEKCSQENIDDFIKSIASGNGLLSYPAFAEKMSILPDSLPLDSHLAYVHMRKLIDVPGATGAKLEKHYKTRFVFFDNQKGEWEIASTRIFDREMSNTIFSNVYNPQRRVHKDSVEVQGNHGWLTTLRRKKPGNRKYEDFPNEIQFNSDKFLVIISNRRYAWLEQSEMMEVLESLNLSPEFKKEQGFFESLVSE